MIKLENIVLQKKVLTKSHGVGTLNDLWLSEANRCYAIINLDDGKTLSTPIDLLTKWSPKDCEHKDITSSDGCDECMDCGVRNY